MCTWKAGRNLLYRYELFIRCMQKSVEDRPEKYNRSSADAKNNSKPTHESSG